jgi:hypothetical protein
MQVNTTVKLILMGIESRGGRLVELDWHGTIVLDTPHKTG